VRSPDATDTSTTPAEEDIDEIRMQRPNPNPFFYRPPVYIVKQKPLGKVPSSS